MGICIYFNETKIDGITYFELIGKNIEMESFMFYEDYKFKLNDNIQLKMLIDDKLILLNAKILSDSFYLYSGLSKPVVGVIELELE